MTCLFDGPFFDYILGQPPLSSAKYFTHGSSTMLFTDEDRLYRLTRQGCGHSFVARESASGNRNVVRVIQDFGPVAPSDEESNEFYWLAQVERLVDLDPDDAITQRLRTILTELTGDESQLYEEELDLFARRCTDFANGHFEFRNLLTTLSTMATFALAHQATADIKLDNIMVRPGSNEIVLADPICDQYFEIDDARRDVMEEIRLRVTGAS